MYEIEYFRCPNKYAYKVINMVFVEIIEPGSAPPTKGPAEGGEKRVTTFFGIPDDDNDNNNEEAEEEEEEGDYVSAALWKTGIQEPVSGGNIIIYLIGLASGLE